VQDRVPHDDVTIKWKQVLWKVEHARCEIKKAERAVSGSSPRMARIELGFQGEPRSKPIQNNAAMERASEGYSRY
jgi:hypothetical protein